MEDVTMSKLLGMKEAMTALHIADKRTLLKLERLGLAVTWIGGRRYYTPEAIESFIRANTGRQCSPWEARRAVPERSDTGRLR